MKTKRLARIVFFMVIVLLPVIAYKLQPWLWLHNPMVSPVERKARELAGVKCTDCGVAVISERKPFEKNLIAVNRCMANAFKTKRAFIGRINRFNSVENSITETCQVGTAEGNVYDLSFDENSSHQDGVLVEKYMHPALTGSPFHSILDKIQ